MAGRHPHMETHLRHLASPSLQHQQKAAGGAPHADATAQPSGDQPQQLQQPWAAAGQPQLSMSQRFTAAAGASLVSALVVNPLDVVKTRMQAQAAGVGGGPLAPGHLLDKWGICSQAPCGMCETVRPGTGPAAAAAAGQSSAPYCAKTAARNAAAQPSTLALMRSIARTEGGMALWRGTSASLLMAVPMVGIYFPLYDALAAELAAGPAGPQAPLLAGAAARTAAVLCTSPLELVRTRMQAALHLSAPAAAELAGAGAAASSGRVKAAGMWAHLPAATGVGMRGRVAALWTGVGATLARDVPFSALYWQLLEPIRHALLPPPASTPEAGLLRGGVGTAAGQPASRRQIVGANLVAGSLAGAFAAAVTTPLDVVKTRAQLAAGGANSSNGGTIRGTLRALHAEGGLGALFAGVGPRAARAAPACAIVVASYEAIKTLYSEE